MILSVQSVKENLPAFSYEPDERDDIMIKHAIDRVIHRALDLTNQCKMPKGLEYEVLNMAIGEFLFLKKTTGGLYDGDRGIKFPTVVKQFTEGDTNVSANAQGKNDEAMFEDMINKMRFGDPAILEHYRRLHW